MKNTLFRTFAILFAMLVVLAVPFTIRAAASENQIPEETEQASIPGGSIYADQKEVAEGQVEDPDLGINLTEATEPEDSPADAAEGAAEMPDPAASEESADNVDPVENPEVELPVEPVVDPKIATLEKEVEVLKTDSAALKTTVTALEEDIDSLRIYVYIALGIAAVSLILAIVALIVGAKDPSREEVEIMRQKVHNLNRKMDSVTDNTAASFQSFERRLDEIDKRV